MDDITDIHILQYRCQDSKQLKKLAESFIVSTADI